MTVIIAVTIANRYKAIGMVEPKQLSLESVQMASYITSLMRSLCRNSRGATAIEYGLIAALIALVVIGAITAIGTNLNTSFNSVANSLH